MYFVYILQCADTTLYTGITTDIERRVQEHNHSKLGAKYTRARRPVKLLYHKKYSSKSEALKAEYNIKKLTRAQKLTVIKKQP